MSEEKPRLSRREMREQGLLKVGREETPVLRDDLLTRTSELQLRRPSRREMRLQREANEVKVAEQSAKLNPPADNVTMESQPEKGSGPRAVHSFDLSGATPAVAHEPVKQTPVASDAGTSAFASGDVKSEQDVLAKAPAVLGDDEVKKDERPATSTGRSSVFDRFTSKDDNTVSFRDRLVARTREGQREARENHGGPSAPAADAPEEQPSGLAGFFGSQPSEGKKEVPAHIDATRVEGSLPVVDDTVEEAPEAERATEPEPEAEPAPEPEPTPVSEPTPEDTADVPENEDEQTDAVADGVEAKAPQGDTVEPKDLVKDSTAVAEAGRYPTDVSMRLTDDDDEEKTGGDRLVSLLIILVGVLIGVVVGLIVQNFIFGAQGIDMNPAYYVQAAADADVIGS